jgi:hypothetical protein
MMQRREMKEQMKQASFRVRKSNRVVAEEFDDTVTDGLNNAR